jgi:hypothetical protein
MRGRATVTAAGRNVSRGQTCSKSVIVELSALFPHDVHKKAYRGFLCLQLQNQADTLLLVTGFRIDGTISHKTIKSWTVSRDHASSRVKEDEQNSCFPLSNSD